MSIRGAIRNAARPTIHGAVGIDESDSGGSASAIPLMLTLGGDTLTLDGEILTLGGHPKGSPILTLGGVELTLDNHFLTLG